MAEEVAVEVPEPADGRSDEQRLVYRWRYLEARDAGMTIAEARVYGDSSTGSECPIDAELLRRARRRGCPQELLARILF